MLFILHIKSTVSDVQDIVEYLPLMSGKQHFLIHLLCIHCFSISVLICFSLSLFAISSFFVEKDILSRHFMFIILPHNPFIIHSLHACENMNECI